MGIVLKYFPIMGAAERVRLALWLGEIEFEDVRIPPVDWPELKGRPHSDNCRLCQSRVEPTLPKATLCSNTLEHLRQSYAQRISF